LLSERRRRVSSWCRGTWLCFQVIGDGSLQSSPKCCVFGQCLLSPNLTRYYNKLLLFVLGRRNNNRIHTNTDQRPLRQLTIHKVIKYPQGTCDESKMRLLSIELKPRDVQHTYVHSAKALQSLYRSVKESENKWVFSLDLKDDSDECCDDDFNSGGRLFHVFAAATEKARSPMVRRRVGGTTVQPVPRSTMKVQRPFSNSKAPLSYSWPNYIITKHRIWLFRVADLSRSSANWTYWNVKPWKFCWRKILLMKTVRFRLL